MTRISIVAFSLFGLLAACGTEKKSTGNAALFEKDNLVA